jgi:molybdenum cofactor cytidylyltransferase
MVPGIILAAGASARMGRPKALLPIGNETFVTRLIRTMLAGGVEDVVVVVGAHAGAVTESLLGSPTTRVRVIENRACERGQMSSLVAAIDVVDRPGVRAVAVTPADIPLIAEGTVRLLLDAYLVDPHPVVRPARGGRHGHPVIFDRALFDEFRTANLALGARAVMAAHADRILDIEVEDEGAFIDIDTPQDYERWIAGRA